MADVESDAGERGSTGCTGLVFSQIQLSHGVRIQLRDYSLHHRKITEGKKVRGLMILEVLEMNGLVTKSTQSKDVVILGGTCEQLCT